MRSKPGAPSERGLVSGGAGRAQARLAWRHLAVEAGRLPTLLPSDPTAPSEAVREQAARAGRPLPRRRAVIMPRPGSGGAGPAGLPPPLLTGLDHGRPCMIMPDRMVAAGPGS